MKEIDDSFFTNDTAWPPFYYAKKEEYYLLGTFLAVVGITGIVGNTLVVVVFTRYKRLKGPFSVLIINLAVGDLVTSMLHLMVVVSSFKGKWAFGRTGCVLYAFGVGYSGMMSIFTLAAISVERYLVIAARPLSKWKMSPNAAKWVCVFSWLYCSFLTLPPMFGWSRYTVEGLLISCTWDYKTRTVENTLFYIYLLSFGFAVPLVVILYCYLFIILAVLAHGKEMSNVIMTQGGVKRYRVNIDPQSSAIKTAEIILVLIISFFLAWTPYAVLTLVGHFGPKGVLTPWLCTIPAVCAKTSVVCNPIVYGWSHSQFKASLRQLLSTWTVNSSGGSGDDEIRRSQPSNHELHYRCFTKKPLPAVINCNTHSTECSKRQRVQFEAGTTPTPDRRDTFVDTPVKCKVKECSV